MSTFTEANLDALRQFHASGLSCCEIAEIFRCKEAVIVSRLTAMKLKPRMTPTANGVQETVKACNCAGCQVELPSISRGSVCVRSAVAGRVLERPYCVECYPLAVKRFARR